MRTSPQGIVEIASHEGVVPAPYRDSVGVMTFGVGHTHAAGGLDPREMNSAMPTGAALEQAVDRALSIFKEDLVKYEQRVLKALPGVELKQHQFDALVSWDFNTGGASWRSKSGQPAALIRQLRAGDYSGAGFMGWLKPPEIRGRREKEQELFQTGRYSGTQVPIYKTDGAGRLRGFLRTMDADEVLYRMGEPLQPKTPPSASFWASLASFWASLAAFIAKLFGGKA
jgi:lysozyme